MPRSPKIWKDGSRNSSSLDPLPQMEHVAAPEKEVQKPFGGQVAKKLWWKQPYRQTPFLRLQRSMDIPSRQSKRRYSTEKTDTGDPIYSGTLIAITPTKRRGLQIAGLSRIHNHRPPSKRK